jgi:hypothetical protein
MGRIALNACNASGGKCGSAANVPVLRKFSSCEEKAHLDRFVFAGTRWRRSPSAQNATEEDTIMQITFRKSLLAALLSGTVAVVTPVLAGSLVMAQTGGTSTTVNGTANGAADQDKANAGANASGAASAPDASGVSGQTSGSVSTQSNGTYGGMNGPSSSKSKAKAPESKSSGKPSDQAPSATPNGNGSEGPQSPSQPHN